MGYNQDQMEKYLQFAYMRVSPEQISKEVRKGTRT